jgi:hypothetical protein
MRCPHGQPENREGARFGAACGRAVASKCPACGNHPPLGAAFCDHCGTPLTGTTTAATPPPLAPRAQGPWAYTPSPLAEKILTSRAALEGERTQVTVLLADLKGSTGLIAGLDPEEARHLLDPVWERRIEAVHRYEGTVNQVLGDGMMALFGAPIAHQGHAVRASRWRRVAGLLRPGRSGRRHQQPAGQPWCRGAGGGRAVASARMSGQQEGVC